MGAFNSFLSFYGKNDSKDWLTSRLVPFFALGLSAFIPIFHAVLLFPYDQLQKQSGLNYYYLEGVCMITGVVFLVVSALRALHVRITNGDSPGFPSAGCRANSTSGVALTRYFIVS